MPCVLTSGRNRACKDNISGIVRVWFADFMKDAATVVNGEVTALDAALVAYKYELQGDSNTFEQSISGDGRNNGTTVHTKTTTIALQKLDKDTQNEIKLLARATPLIFVEDRAGNIFAVGLEEGNDMTTGTSTTGSAMADFSGYNLVFTANSKDPAPFLDDAAKTALIAQTAPEVITP